MSAAAPLREASSTILLRRAEPGFEVFLLRRRKAASFMANAFVFPGGAAEPGEDARTAAARELFEEAGVLLAKMRPAAAATSGSEFGQERATMQMTSLSDLRRAILDGANATARLGLAGYIWAPDTLVPWSHWITPSVEPKRFSARFFVTELPSGQDPTYDDIETVEQVWIRPADALARSAELLLPPPQIRTCWELSHFDSISAVLAAGRARAEEPHPILPRLRAMEAGDAPCLLLPWDPEYTVAGTGDSAPLTYVPSWAGGPSRFVLEDRAWQHVAGSTPPG